MAAGALVFWAFITLGTSGCGAAPPQAAMNQLGNRVEAGRATTTPAFAHPSSTRGGIHAPYAIAAGAGGVWFTEYSAPMLGLMELSGTFKQVELDQDGFPERLTIARDGAVWFTSFDGNQIERMTLDGEVTGYVVPTESSFPYHIVAGPDGALWFTEMDGNAIGRLALKTDAFRLRTHS